MLLKDEDYHMGLIRQLKENHKSINDWAVPLHYLLSTFLSKRKHIQLIHGSMFGEELLRNRKDN